MSLAELQAQIREHASLQIFMVQPAIAAQPVRRQLQMVRPSVDGTASSAAPAQQTVRNARDIGRNDPCWCGSGKKYKQCHYREDRAAVKQTQDA